MPFMIVEITDNPLSKGYRVTLMYSFHTIQLEFDLQKTIKHEVRSRHDREEQTHKATNERLDCDVVSRLYTRQ